MARGIKGAGTTSPRGFVYREPKYTVDSATGVAKVLTSALSKATADRYRREIMAALGLENDVEGRSVYRKLYQQAKNKTQTFNMTTGSDYSPLAYLHAKTTIPRSDWSSTIKTIEKTSGAKKITAKNVTAAESYLFGTVRRIMGEGDDAIYSTDGGRFSNFISTSAMTGQGGRAFHAFNEYMKVKNGDVARPGMTLPELIKRLKEISDDVKRGKKAPLDNFY